MPFTETSRRNGTDLIEILLTYVRRTGKPTLACFVCNAILRGCWSAENNECRRSAAVMHEFHIISNQSARDYVHQLDAWQLLSMRSKIIYYFGSFFWSLQLDMTIDQMTFPKRVDRRRGISKGYLSLFKKGPLQLQSTNRSWRSL